MNSTAKASKAAKPSQTVKPYHKGNVAEDLYSAASRLIESEGLESLTVRRLCREVGVTAANFYNHYPNLEHLLLNLAAAGYHALDLSTVRSIKRKESRDEALVAVSVEFVEFSMKHPNLFRVMFGQVQGVAAHQGYQQASAHSFGELVKLIYGENIYRPDDLDWSHANCRKAYAQFAFMYGLARTMSMGLIEARSKAERMQFVKELVWIFIHGLDGPEPGAV